MQQTKLIFLFLLVILTASMHFANADEGFEKLCTGSPHDVASLTESAIGKQLGWVATNENRCGGYYLEAPFISADRLSNSKEMQIISNEGLFSLHGTSVSQGKVTISQNDQQVIANKAYLYRDPTTEKYSTIDLIGDVALREPNHLVLAKCGHYDLKTGYKSLYDILYRTPVYSTMATPVVLNTTDLQNEHKVYQLSAWGTAEKFQQTAPKIYTFQQASITTCSPNNDAWRIVASDIVLNKNTGRGTATNARVLVKNVPILYAPYFNFPIDSRRQTGFLSPAFGTSSQSGPYLTTPFYWNLAPNYDDTITPSYLSKRGLQTVNVFRYLTPESRGDFNLALLPNDRFFSDFKQSSKNEFASSTDPGTQANLKRLEETSTTRRAVSWQDNTHFNDHWSANVDYNYVGDDYYLTDFKSGFNQTTPNQLLQQAQINYKGQYWNFLGRVQGYETLHPVDQAALQNQYSRLPQLALDGNYSDEKTGLNYFIGNDLSNFDIANNPGDTTKSPVGERLNVQPGISYPFYRPYFYFTPRIQFAMTQYQLSNVANNNSTDPSRALPILDLNSGLYFDRNIHFFSYDLRQTLEPQIYYTYVPFRDQSQIPIFDTTLNTLNYDQLFTYNRFSGLDRIGDANQISVGIATRFIDQQSGMEKMRAGIGQIFYFEDRRVTLCNEASECSDYPGAPENKHSRSPLSGVLNYNLTPNWSATANTIWNPQTKEVDNQTLTLQYQRDAQRNIALTYTFIRNGDVQAVEPIGSSANNLSQTDVAFTWPISRDWSAVGRWTQNWNRSRFQNLFYGLQYDTCCWAVRFVTGRAYTNLTPNNTYRYNTEFFAQVALKGLGTFGTGDPSHMLTLNSGVSTYQTNFGQDY